MQKVFVAISTLLLIINIGNYPIYGNNTLMHLKKIFPVLDNNLFSTNQKFWFDTSINFKDAYLEIKKINANKMFCVYPAHGYFSEFIADFGLDDIKYIYMNHAICNNNGSPLGSVISLLPNKNIRYILLIDGWAEPSLYQELINAGWIPYKTIKTMKHNRDIIIMNYK